MRTLLALLVPGAELLPAPAAARQLAGVFAPSFGPDRHQLQYRAANESDEDQFGN